MQTQYHSIEDLVANVHAQALRKRDFVTDVSNAVVQPDGKTMVLKDQPTCGYVDGTNASGTGFTTKGFKGTMDEAFIRGISDFGGLPKRYVDQMLAEGQHQLIAQNLNAWLQNPPSGKLRSKDANRLFRAYGGDNSTLEVSNRTCHRFRSFHSDKYRVFDNTQLLKHVYPALEEIRDKVGGLDIQSMALTEKRMYLKIFFPDVKQTIAEGDIVRSGLIISNSEIGEGSIEVWPMILRLICLNGMTFDEGGKRRRHLGRVTKEGEIEYKADTMAAEDEALSLKLRDVVNNCADRALFAKKCEKLTEAAGSVTPDKPLKAIELVTDQFELTEDESDHAKEAFILGQDFSKWGMLNAVTSIANQERVCSYERACEVEKIGSAILDLNSSEWQTVCQAGTEVAARIEH